MTERQKALIVIALQWRVLTEDADARNPNLTDQVRANSRLAARESGELAGLIMNDQLDGFEVTT